MDKPFSVRIEDNLLLIKPVKDEPGITHRLIINGELYKCNFAYNGDRLRTEEEA